MTDVFQSKYCNKMDISRKSVVKIALRFTVFLLYLSIKLKPSNISTKTLEKCFEIENDTVLRHMAARLLSTK